jgi:hypothetical protein
MKVVANNPALEGQNVILNVNMAKNLILKVKTPKA